MHLQKLLIPLSLGFFLLSTVMFTGCKEHVDVPLIPINPDSSGGIGQTLKPADDIKIFDSLTFSALGIYEDYGNQYFSTFDTSFKRPRILSDLTAEQLKNVDILFTYDADYSEPGFMNPYISSEEAYWNSSRFYYYPWLSGSVNTLMYLTRLNKQQLDSAKQFEGYLSKYFYDTSLVHIVRSEGREIFPNGSMIGGKSLVYDPTWDMTNELKKEKIFGFENTLLNKHGFIFIRKDQEPWWPMPLFHFNTRIDIVMEK